MNEQANGAIPGGVLGGATTVLYGLIAVLGARIWVESRVDFRDPVNLLTAAVALIVGAANFRFTQGDVTLEGIALGTLAAVIGSSAMPRTEVTKKIWGYIKRNGLQDKKNKRMINSDEKLKPVFGGKSQVSMFEMTKLVSKHLK